MREACQFAVPVRQQLKRGESVQDGQTLQPANGAPPPYQVLHLFVGHKTLSNAERRRADSTVLYHDATFNDSDADRAKATHHSTTIEAGRLARQAGVGTLVLGHVSLRYRDLNAIRSEALLEHPNVVVAEDGMVIRVGS